MAGTSGNQVAGRELPTQQPPEMGGWPLIGNIPQLYRDTWGFYDEMAERGDVVSYSLGTTDFTVLLHPDYIEQVLVTENDKFGKWGFDEIGGDFGAESLVQTEGEQWRRQRTIIQNAFTMDRIRSYADSMGAYAAATVDSWADGEELVLNDEFSHMLLRVLTHSLFNLDIEAGAEQVTDFTDVAGDIGDIGTLSTFLPMWVPTPTNRRFKRAQQSFESFVDELIDERRGNAEDYDDLLSLMLTGTDESGAGLSDAEVRDQMAGFLFAGHETSSLALTYACMELATRPELCDTLRTEYDEQVDGDVPTFTEIPQLDATERVVKETLRLYPPAYIMFREAREDVSIGGFRVPEGQKISLPQYYIHRDERFYDDPEQFDPDRWTDDFEDDLHEYAYFPFGGGPRHCIAMRFAMLELKCALAMILPRVDLELLSDPDPEFQLGITLKPKDDVRARVHRR